MKTSKLLTRAAVLLALSTLNPQLSTLAQSTAFTYQGRLNDGGEPATGLYDLQFSVYDAPANGNSIAGPLISTATGVTNGLFTVTLDFGNVFDGTDRWLEIAVQTNGATSFATLAPRQQLTPAPYAITAATLNGVQIQPNNSGAPNFIGGSPGNFIPPGVVGAVIGGGGATNYYDDFQAYSNSVSSDFGTIGGGRQNNIARTALLGTIGGGDDNSIAYGAKSTIGGGSGNTVSAPFGTIGGGDNNAIQPHAWGATIAGGEGNIVQIAPPNIQSDAVIGGGVINTIASYAATIAGGYGNLIDTNADYATVAGGQSNTIGTNASQSVIGGGGQYQIAPGALSATVAGGQLNTATANFGAVGGGAQNTNTGIGATIAGGQLNTASGTFATVAGGYVNSAGGYASTVGGGDGNVATSQRATVGGGESNVANNDFATVAGGQFNRAFGPDSLVAGGQGNIASGPAATVAGGANNIAAGQYSFAAGQQAQANHQGAFVWADSQNAPFASTANDQFLLRAQGGVGIGTANPQSALHVNGTVTAANFAGSGAGLTGLNPANLGAGTAPINITGNAATATTATSANSVAAANIAGTILNSSLPPSPSFSGTVSAANFIGSGAGLTGVAQNYGTVITSAPYTITQPGLYYLTNNITVSSGNAITINANHVTLNLNGFTISSSENPATTGIGVSVNSVTNVTISNGAINCGVVTDNAGTFSGSGFAYGIGYLNSLAPASVRVSGVSVSGGVIGGIRLGYYGSVVQFCTVNGAGFLGITTDMALDTTAQNCGGVGIECSTAINCVGSCYEVAAGGYGILAIGTANNCRGSASGSGIAIGAGTAAFCAGEAPTGTAIKATIANSCIVVSGSTSITYKYNMP